MASPKVVSSNEFVIDKGVAMPATADTGRAAKYPWSAMMPGDSIFVAGQGAGGSAANSGRKYGHLHGQKFVARSVDGGVRVWRVL